MKIVETLISQEDIQKRVQGIAKVISAEYSDANPIFVGLLKGSFIFMADLVRSLTIPCEIDFMVPSSYGNSTKSSGVVRLLYDIEVDISGRDVILVEDIVDTGLTLNFIKKELSLRNPKSVKVCALLEKGDAKMCEVEVDYLGFSIPDKFVVGYGLDYAQQYRNLPSISILEL